MLDAALIGSSYRLEIGGKRNLALLKTPNLSTFSFNFIPPILSTPLKTAAQIMIVLPGVKA